MSSNDRFEQRLGAWLEATSIGVVPDHLDEVLVTTSAIGQRPGWASLERWLPMAAIARTLPVPRRTGLALLAALVLLTIAAAAAYFAAGWPPKPLDRALATNGRIYIADGRSIRSFSADGGDPRLEGTFLDAVGSLSVSPDGTRLAFVVGDSQIKVRTLATGSTGDLANTRGLGANLAWSPRSDELAYVFDDEAGSHLVVAGVTRGEFREVTATGMPKYLWQPAWSPDGGWIAVIGAGFPETGNGVLYRVSVDGARLEAAPATSVARGEGGPRNAGGDVQWSPDRGTARVLFMQYDQSVRVFDFTTMLQSIPLKGFWPTFSAHGDRLSRWDRGTVLTATAALIGGRPDQVRPYPAMDGDCGAHRDRTGAALCGPALWSPDDQWLIGPDVTLEAILAIRADGSGVTMRFPLGEPTGAMGGFVAWQPRYP